MSIEEIRKRRDAIDGAPWKYENRGQTVFGFSPGGCNKTPSDYMVANIRGWGHLQYMGETRGDAKAQAMQDANGEFIANAPSDIDTLLALVAWIDDKPECRAAQFRTLQDENSILRAALKQFVDMPDKFPEDQFMDGWARMRAAFSNAKAVLQTP